MNSLLLADRSISELTGRMDRSGLGDWWTGALRQISRRLQPRLHGHWNDWARCLSRLPPANDAHLNIEDGAVAIDGRIPEECSEVFHQQLADALRILHPWRKGPFRFFNQRIDTEWRSDLKWNRLEGLVDFSGADVLDVGCGNGYFGWRMLSDGAASVVGFEPQALYLAQHAAVRNYLNQHRRHILLPLTDESLQGCRPMFDIVCSMGVLYHRTSPVDHLKLLKSAVRPGGTVVLETLVLPDTAAEEQVPDAGRCLVPAARYARMRNVWFVPETEALCGWAERTGFRNIQVHSVVPTSTEEQRSTDWMRFESLAECLRTDNSEETVEGYPAPLRALMTMNVP